MRRLHTKLKKRLSHRGDTLVEVLIALAIISAILGGAFTVTRSSILAVHDSGEHQTAWSLAQTQLEKLKSRADSDPDSVFSTDGNFCISHGSAVSLATDAECSVDSSGIPTTTQPVYNESIAYNSSTSIFTITINWPRIGGGNDQVQMSYRLYAPSGSLGGSPSGSADFGDPPPYDCTDDCEPDDGGSGPPPPPDYFWGWGFQNHTDPSEASLITGCEWDWGDGTPPLVNEACMPNEETDHEFAPPPGFDPTYNPSVCYTLHYTVTLTVHLINGLSPTKSNIYDVPGCPG
ncbi:MAG TPA: prepilin-type N-terminal cleavage/methylation domain-containing protein [Candidatus Saccharimonadales bacterium]|nr:prepilin-type N-terminal cleavage/methylation domain-containing protein [Candidatus Saccharimonadales bacterium]